MRLLLAVYGHFVPLTWMSNCHFYSDNERRLLVGSPRDGEGNNDGDKQGMIYKCRLGNRQPLNQVCTPFVGNSSTNVITTVTSLH